ncbi:hypothetical protein ACWCP6_01660 [Streptomyces sp. NPDC002004]
MEERDSARKAAYGSLGAAAADVATGPSTGGSLGPGPLGLRGIRDNPCLPS